jgi:CRP-like cAMP-binding protein
MTVPRDPFMKFLGETPELMLHVIEMLCERLRNTTESVADIIFLDLRTRLAKRLVALAVGYGRETPDGIRIALKLSQSDLGRLLGATREAVNKQLHALIEEKLIALDGRTIVVREMQALRGIAGEIGHAVPPPIEE